MLLGWQLASIKVKHWTKLPDCLQHATIRKMCISPPPPPSYVPRHWGIWVCFPVHWPMGVHVRVPSSSSFSKMNPESHVICICWNRPERTRVKLAFGNEVLLKSGQGTHKSKGWTCNSKNMNIVQLSNGGTDLPQSFLSYQPRHPSSRKLCPHLPEN